MDLITQKFFRSFLTEMNIKGEENERSFEKFVNHSILSPKNIAGFDLTSISTGDGGDCAIDGLAIVLNNIYVANYGQLEDLLRTGMDIKVEFYFIQAKTSEKFEGKEMLQFGSGVIDIFNNGNIRKVRNSKIQEKCRMIELLMDNYDYFEDAPKCYLYYVTTGVWVNDMNLLADIQKIKNDIVNLEIFEDNVEFYPLGAKELRKHYKLTKEQNSATFYLDKKIELPPMEGLEESFLAIMPIKEYLNIIVDDDGKIKKGIFELNVRDFNGIENNRVNQDILNTIRSEESKSFFGLLNNGITVVGKSSSKLKGKYTIKNFYVVNGCQTSNIIYQAIDEIDDSMWVSIKIVITDNDEIIQDIVKATNNQTEVQEIQLLSMTEYQKLLEHFYEIFDEKYQLYYERRSGQYNSDYRIDKSRVVTTDMQIRAYASIILDYPHIASRYYGHLLEGLGLEDTGRGIFVTGQSPLLYYTSGLLLVHIDNCFNNDLLDSKLVKFKYHILFIFSKLVWKDVKRPPLNSKKIDDYCNLLIEKILDENSFNSFLEKSKEILKIVIPNLDDLEANRSASIVNSLQMYTDIGVTSGNLRTMTLFVGSMEDIYLIPFQNMRIDGDKRYNFYDRLNELIYRIRSYKLNSVADNLVPYITSVNFESRESRRQAANEIFTYINDVCKKFKNIIQLSKKYLK
ncbi:AIPR family protein [Paenibacillus barcinonensis]|uniref:AIPR family protein n=1 Tax=Paenibacillus barcinonensis TaxID=198119 RepID=UPI001C0FBBCA|nr:AIPR family protein [Paenibacillus barcinonensis]MBU5353939.1 AIPR family protein [Paenibacillus barcinonensis]